MATEQFETDLRTWLMEQDEEWYWVHALAHDYPRHLTQWPPGKMKKTLRACTTVRLCIKEGKEAVEALGGLIWPNASAEEEVSEHDDAEEHGGAEDEGADEEVPEYDDAEEHGAAEDKKECVLMDSALHIFCFAFLVRVVGINVIRKSNLSRERI